MDHKRWPFWVGICIFTAFVLASLVRNRFFWFDESYSYAYASQIITYDSFYLFIFLAAIVIWFIGSVDKSPSDFAKRWKILLPSFFIVCLIVLMFSIPPADVHPPLHYLGLHFWMLIFGGSIYVIRLMAVLFGILSLVFIYKILQKILTKQSEINLYFICVSFLFGLASTTVHFFTENRMYAPGIFFSVLGFYYFIQLSEDGDSYIFSKFLVVAVISAWLHYFTVPLFLLEIGFLLFLKGFKKKYWVYLLVVIFIAALPSMIYGYQQYHRIGAPSPTVPGVDKSDFVKNIITEYVPYNRILSVYYHYFFHINEPYVALWQMILGYSFIALVVFVLLLYFIIADRGNEWKYILLLCFLGFATPMISIIAESLFRIYFFHVRYFIFEAWMIIVAFVLAVVSLRKFVKPVLYWTLFSVTVFIFLFNCLYYYKSLSTGELEGLSIPLGYCSKLEENLTIVHETPFTYFPFQTYTRGSKCINYMIVPEMDEPELRGLGGDAIPFNKRLLSVDNFSNYIYMANGVVYNCGIVLYNTSDGLTMYWRNSSDGCVGTALEELKRGIYDKNETNR